MMKIDLSDGRCRKTLIIIEYICFILLIVMTIIFIGLKIDSKNSKSIISTEISKINTVQTVKGETNNNIKVEVFEYDKLSYYIKVNCKLQNVTIYTTDENGKYTIPVKKMICSTGTATPNRGVYKISDKYEWRSLVGNVYGQYATRITGSILFHSVPYTKMSKSSLEYWEYDKLGQPASKGCVRLTVEDAKWIFDYCKPGTKVEFCEEDEQSENKSKSTMKISGYSQELRGWDPTDPDPHNPWLEYEEIDEE